MHCQGASPSSVIGIFIKTFPESHKPPCLPPTLAVRRITTQGIDTRSAFVAGLFVSDGGQGKDVRHDDEVGRCAVLHCTASALSCSSGCSMRHFHKAVAI